MKAVEDGLTHLLRLDVNQRRDWLDRRQPASNRLVNLWLYLLLVIEQQLLRQEAGRQPEWVGLTLTDVCISTEADAA
jgi:hypothetical protein